MHGRVFNVIYVMNTNNNYWYIINHELWRVTIEISGSEPIDTLGNPCLKNYIAFSAFLQEAICQICLVGYCDSLPRLEEFIHIISFIDISNKHHFIHLPKIKHVVPNSYERDPKKKAKSSSELRHQGCKWVALS